MRNAAFSKYHGTGNDFILIDNRSNEFSGLNERQIAHICHRRFGIGADGLILAEGSGSGGYRMRFFNSDGIEGSMCGNGGRCFAAYLFDNGLAGKKIEFEAFDGVHHAEILSEKGNPVQVKLKMADIQAVSNHNDDVFLDSGSPHYVRFCKNPDEIDVVGEGKKIRHAFRPEGTNVNFVSCRENSIRIRTYERGVENETLSCGTGTVASIIAAHSKGLLTGNYAKAQTRGGMLCVHYNLHEGIYSDIWLEGPAEHVFNGKIQISDEISGR
ncbi:MAG: diaminopimelate epimerase [Bacteroidetes bacterium]|nr:diaminopimelate epimerase [Bacteroidota bacterium]MBU1719858.1 diaminopimelate epimerase [Bacteroidota bacterium]